MPGSLKALRLHHLVLGGGITPAQLEAELASPMALGAWEASMRQRSAIQAITHSTAAMLTITAAPSALVSLARQAPQEYIAALASPEYLAAVTASETLLGNILSSVPTKLALWECDAAIAAMQSATTSRNFLSAHPSAVITNTGLLARDTWTTNGMPPGKSLMLGWSISDQSGMTSIVLEGRRAGSTAGLVSATTLNTGTTAAQPNFVPLGPSGQRLQYASSLTATRTVYLKSIRMDV